jgi:hypothetical protein
MIVPQSEVTLTGLVKAPALSTSLFVQVAGERPLAYDMVISAAPFGVNPEPLSVKIVPWLTGFGLALTCGLTDCAATVASEKRGDRTSIMRSDRNKTNDEEDCV